jgi:hypothetical protein
LGSAAEAEPVAELVSPQLLESPVLAEQLVLGALVMVTTPLLGLRELLVALGQPVRPPVLSEVQATALFLRSWLLAALLRQPEQLAVLVGPVSTATVLGAAGAVVQAVATGHMPSQARQVQPTRRPASAELAEMASLEQADQGVQEQQQGLPAILDSVAALVQAAVAVAVEIPPVVEEPVVLEPQVVSGPQEFFNWSGDDKRTALHRT